MSRNQSAIEMSDLCFPCNKYFDLIFLITEGK